MNTLPQYIYHNEKARHYYGRYNSTENDIVYTVQFDPATMQELPTKQRRASQVVDNNEFEQLENSNLRRKHQGLGVEEAWLQYSQHMYSVINRIEEEQEEAMHASHRKSKKSEVLRQYVSTAHRSSSNAEHQSSWIGFFQQFIPNIF